jgi:hypothetical protein
MRIGRWKIRIGPRGTPLVGDMAGDPGETTDASRSHPVERRMLTDNLGMFLAIRTQWQKATWGVVTSVTPAGAAALDELATVEPKRVAVRTRTASRAAPDAASDAAPEATPDAESTP